MFDQRPLRAMTQAPISTTANLDALNDNDLGLRRSFADALTLRELSDRLLEIIAYHDAQGWSDRNDNPATIRLEQPRTATGRTRRAVYVPITGAGTASHGVAKFHGGETQWASCLNGATTFAR